MAYAKICVFTLLMMTFLGGLMGAEIYQVGDAAGWNNQGTNYQLWTSGKKFRVGDTFIFTYNPLSHNVMQVTKDDFEACSAIAPLSTYTSGSDPITLYTSGSFYFICGYPGMCLEGQKVEIEVIKSTKDNTPINMPPCNLMPGYMAGSTCYPSSALSLNNHLIGIMILASCVLGFYLH